METAILMDHIFYDQSISPDKLMCVFPGSTLNGGEWVAPSGSSVDCSTI